MKLRTLLSLPQYSLTFSEKRELMLPLIKEQLIKAYTFNTHICSWFQKIKFDPYTFVKLDEIPFMPVQMFKLFDVGIVPKEKVQRILKSSSTTSQNPSNVPLDKETSFSQTIALSSILENYIGDNCKPFLVFDHVGVNSDEQVLTARGAGVRGLSILAKETYYLLKMRSDNSLEIDWDVFKKVIDQHRGESVFGFGFTFIIWSVFLSQLKKMDPENIMPFFDFKDFTIFHSGGWKNLKKNSVSKELFSELLASFCNTEVKNIRDFYGMAEQGGIIFVDCEYGFKHVPNHALVQFLDPYSLLPVSVGDKGMIQVVSAIASSYYGQSILTEDIGILNGIDDCPCGRKGERFTFHSRIEKAEIRGCGDTFRLNPRDKGVG